jgi:hypothetical protein
MKARRARGVDSGEGAPAPAAAKDQTSSIDEVSEAQAAAAELMKGGKSGSKENVVSRGGAGGRGRYLPMLGDRAGE